ncbi:MAG: hypothetical protein KBG67_01240 [Candidatus Atribacteria bacterium]|nr:hypothetical protein [Candidatus Atribacteria bacterium]
MVKPDYYLPQSEGLFILNGPDLRQYLYIAPLLNAGRAYDWILRITTGDKKKNIARWNTFSLPSLVDRMGYAFCPI